MPSTQKPLAQQAPSWAQAKNFRNGERNGILGERLVWNGRRGRDRGHPPHPYQPTIINYYADGMESNFILAVAGFPPGSTLLPKRLWFS